jgi:hypothetical protein
MNMFDEFDEQTDLSFLGVTEQKCPVVAKKAKKAKKAKTNSATPRSNTISVTFIYDRSFQKTDEYRQMMSNALKGREVPWHKGVPLSDKAKASLKKAGFWASRPSPNKGITLSKVTRQKIADASPFKRQVMTPDGVFPSLRAAQAHYGVACSTMYSWVYSKSMPEFYYTEETKRKKISESTRAKLSASASGPKPHRCKPMMTPAGVMASRNEAMAFFGIRSKAMAQWMREHPQHFYYITKD